MRIAIAGIGHTSFGKSTATISELLFEASTQAITDAHTTIDAVDAVYISNFSSRFSNQCHLPSVFASLWKTNKEIIRVESACASGAAAIKEAVIAIESGLYKTVLVVGVEKMTATPTEIATEILATAGSQEEMKHGATFPSLYALIAQRYLHTFGAKEEHLAMVAVKNHKNALLNPHAHFHKEITLQDALQSPLIAAPLRLFDCSPLSDGAAALLLCAEDIAHQFTATPVFLIGIGHDVDAIELYKRKDLTTMPAVVRAAKKAFIMAERTPKDIDLAELHDCFTIAEILQMEDLGFCEKGQAKIALENGITERGGSLPINVSGGLKAKGHPIGATGISQAVEIVQQLQERAGQRQIKNARLGLCCNIGGTGSSAFVIIFSR